MTLAGSILTLTPAQPMPPVRVTVRATDPDGLTRALTFTVTVTAGDRDYDADNDNLIDVATLAQLDAVRYDLDGNGWVDGSTWRPYYEAFDEGTYAMGCPDGVRRLRADSPTWTSTPTAAAGPDAGDDYWNGGLGWDSIGSDADSVRRGPGRQRADHRQPVHRHTGGGRQRGERGAVRRDRADQRHPRRRADGSRNPGGR